MVEEQYFKLSHPANMFNSKAKGDQLNIHNRKRSENFSSNHTIPDFIYSIFKEKLFHQRAIPLTALWRDFWILNKSNIQNWFA